MGVSESSMVVGTEVITGSKMTFLQAITSGDIVKVKKALTKDIDINKRYQLGETALYHSAAKGFTEVTEYLLQMGAQMTITTNTGTLPIHVASWKGHIEVLRILIKHNADVNVRNKKNMTPIYLAVCQGRLDVADMLLKYGADLNERPQGCTLLHNASKNGNLHIVEYLVSRGALLNIGDSKCGSQPIHVASWHGQYKIVSYLIEHGVHPSCTTGRLKMTPLHMAVIENKLDCVQILIDAGADMSAGEAKLNMTPLHYAACKGHCDILIHLLNQGANISATDNNGLTPLHIAVSADKIDCAKVLLKYGADKYSKTKKGLTPIQLVKINSHEMKALLSVGVPPTAFVEVEPSAPPAPPETYDVEPYGTDIKQLEFRLNIKLGELQECQTKCTSLQGEIDDIRNQIDGLKSSPMESAYDASLECPICFDVPKAPLKVFQCTEGHIFCEECSRHGITHCPECRMLLVKPYIRNRRLEEIIQNLK